MNFREFFREINVKFREFFSGAPKMMRYDAGLIVHSNRVVKILQQDWNFFREIEPDCQYSIFTDSQRYVLC